ncbi:hypothetical protein EYF80_038503 [Liparis tanakae]|uniref:Uncharacterized protein n=1 Tax=Liparis tanakae TaxID=230148 RepID=A0A4Z2GDS6_9TELE|nr:hypothetical protein EYF80_038503 [Liparis tanakae]
MLQGRREASPLLIGKRWNDFEARIKFQDFFGVDAAILETFINNEIQSVFSGAEAEQTLDGQFPVMYGCCSLCPGTECFSCVYCSAPRRRLCDCDSDSREGTVWGFETKPQQAPDCFTLFQMYLGKKGLGKWGRGKRGRGKRGRGKKGRGGFLSSRALRSQRSGSGDSGSENSGSEDSGSEDFLSSRAAASYFNFTKGGKAARCPPLLRRKCD